MILRIVHSAVPLEKKEAWIEFVNSSLAPTVRKAPGCRFMYVADCIEKGHECEVVHISGWDSMENAEAFEQTAVYPGAATRAQTFYTERYQHGAPHVHYETVAVFD